MGLTHLEVGISHPARPRRSLTVTCLVDSGAVYSVIPTPVLRRLGIRPHSTRIFTLADGSQISRKVGDALFMLNGQRGSSPVIFGQRGDSALLGIISLDALGLMLDPIRRELRPLRLMLAPAAAIGAAANSPHQRAPYFVIA
jgi:predicted aspartyl protease